MDVLARTVNHRIIFIGLLVGGMVVVSNSAHAQTYVGIKGGLNVADIVMTNYVNPDVEADLRLKAGMHAGIFMKGMIKERVGLAGELLYSNKGVKGNTDIHLRYINVPLLVRYRLSEKIFGELGPELGYLFSATSPHGDVSGTYNNRLDLGIDGGFTLEGSRLELTLRYCAGLLSVRELQPAAMPSPERVKYQNRVLQLSVGYKLWKLE